MRSMFTETEAAELGLVRVEFVGGSLDGEHFFLNKEIVEDGTPEFRLYQSRAGEIYERSKTQMILKVSFDSE